MRDNGGKFSIVLDDNTSIMVSENHGCMTAYGWNCPRCRSRNIFTLFSAPSSGLKLSCSKCGLEVELRKHRPYF